MHDCAAFQPFSLPEHAKAHYDLGYAAGLRAARAIVHQYLLGDVDCQGYEQLIADALDAALAAREKIS